MSLIVPQSSQLNLLGSLKAAGQPLVAPKAHLYSNNVVPGPGSKLSDFTEATFPGYASGSFVFDAPFTNPGGAAEMDSTTTIQWGASGPPITPETEYGYFVTDAAGTTLLYAERFDSPFTVANTGDTIVLLPRFTLQSEF